VVGDERLGCGWLLLPCGELLRKSCGLLRSGELLSRLDVGLPA
jgi:hypothetical protein